MDPTIVTTLLAVLGLMLGSFAGAQVWRLRARQLREEDKLFADLKKQTKLSRDEREDLEYLAEEAGARQKERLHLDGLLGGVTEDYSRCLSCQHKLAWYDLLPLVSWLSTGGKCRYCHARIGKFEPLMEIGVAAVFALSYLLWPLPTEGAQGLLLFALWLLSVVLLAVLFAYDLKWFLLPNSLVFSLIGVGAVMTVIRLLNTPNALAVLTSTGGAVLVLSGLYFLLYHVSRHQWVGFGDVKLGLGLALLLGDWRLALLALFLANLIGSLAVLPGMALGKLHRKAHVPFGPLLIAGTIIAMLIGERVISYYLTLSF